MQAQITNHRINHKRGLRAAFTLIELLLVLAVIVALAGLSWPQLSGFLKRESVMSDVEQVRQILDHARVQAVEDGVRYQFRYEPNGRKYLLLPYELLVESGETSSSAGSPPTLPGEIKQAIVHELSEECYFYTPTSLSGDPVVVERLPEAWLTMVRDGTMQRDVSWAGPIVYSPDGSASDGSVTVADQDRRYISLSVRGLTGAVVTSRLSQLPELFGASSK